MDILLKDIDKIDFNSPKLKSEWEELENRNKLLLESTKVNRKALNKTFDI